MQSKDVYAQVIWIAGLLGNASLYTYNFCLHLYISPENNNEWMVANESVCSWFNRLKFQSKTTWEVMLRFCDMEESKTSQMNGLRQLLNVLPRLAALPYHAFLMIRGYHVQSISEYSNAIWRCKCSSNVDCWTSGECQPLYLQFLLVLVHFSKK